jgi:tetratricopeptide (TPR) repeat protein
LYRRAVEIAPNNNTAANNLANEMFQRGYYGDAIRLYQEVLTRNPNFGLSNYNLGYSYYKLDNLEEAERYLIRSISISPLDADRFIYLGLTRAKMGRLKEAEDSIRHAIELHADGRGFHFALGYVLKQEGDLAGALEEFKQELVYNPDQSAASGEVSDIEARLRESRFASQRARTGTE